MPKHPCAAALAVPSSIIRHALLVPLGIHASLTVQLQQAVWSNVHGQVGLTPWQSSPCTGITITGLLLLRGVAASALLLLALLLPAAGEEVAMALSLLGCCAADAAAPAPALSAGAAVA